AGQRREGGQDRPEQLPFPPKYRLLFNFHVWSRNRMGCGSHTNPVGKSSDGARRHVAARPKTALVFQHSPPRPAVSGTSLETWREVGIPTPRAISVGLAASICPALESGEARDADFRAR